MVLGQDFDKSEPFAEGVSLKVLVISGMAWFSNVVWLNIPKTCLAAILKYS